MSNAIPPEAIPGRDSPQYKMLVRLAEQLRGLPIEWIIWVLMNLLVNTLRYKYRTKRDAKECIDMLFERSRAILMSHYGPDGKRREVVIPTSTPEQVQ